MSSPTSNESPPLNVAHLMSAPLEVSGPPENKSRQNNTESTGWDTRGCPGESAGLHADGRCVIWDVPARSQNNCEQAKRVEQEICMTRAKIKMADQGDKG
jgi:hypothetical protein